VLNREKYKLVEEGIVVKTRLSATDDEPYELLLDATVAGRGVDDFESGERARGILELLDESGINHGGRNGVGQHGFEVHIGRVRYGYGVFRMSAELKWPAVSDQSASNIATDAMRRMARNLGIYKDKNIDSLVYANVRRSDGITLETNPAGSCGMDTDGMKYSPDSETVSLIDHNLYTHEMQLVCISGLIALANAK